MFSACRSCHYLLSSRCSENIIFRRVKLAPIHFLQVCSTNSRVLASAHDNSQIRQKKRRFVKFHAACRSDPVEHGFGTRCSEPLSVISPLHHCASPPSVFRVAKGDSILSTVHSTSFFCSHTFRRLTPHSDSNPSRQRLPHLVQAKQNVPFSDKRLFPSRT